MPQTLRVAAVLLSATLLVAAAITLLRTPAEQKSLPVGSLTAQFEGEEVYLLLADGGLMSNISRGTYGFEVLEWEGKLAKVRVRFCAVGSSLQYLGINSRTARNLSFVSIPRIEESELLSVLAEPGLVTLRGNFSICGEAVLLLDPSSGVAVDPSGGRLGKFLLWIDSTKVPDQRCLTEVMVESLPQGPVSWSLSREALSPPLKLLGETVDSCIKGWSEDLIYATPSLRAGSPVAYYDERTGAFLASPTVYADDVLYGKFGVVAIVASSQEWPTEPAIRVVELENPG